MVVVVRRPTIVVVRRPTIVVATGDLDAAFDARRR